ncbi:MAG: glycerophosphodiester phosphodiesterase family protein [Bacteroidota bacterium]
MYLNKNIISVFALFLLLCSCQSPTKEPQTEHLDADSNPKANTVEAITSFDQWLEDPQPLISAHRGGPYPGFPENAIETFQNIAEQVPTIIECDISMTKDSVLILMHDKTLDRTSTGSGNVLDQVYDEVKDLLLVDNEGDTTSFHIPTLDDVLSWGGGKVLFTLDVKRGVPFEKVVAAVEKFEAASYAAIITYSIKDAVLVHAMNPNIMISVSAGNDGALEQIVKSGIPVKNLLGFVGIREPDSAHYAKLQELGIKTILGTLGNLDKSAAAKGDDSVYLTYIKNGAHIIATDRPLEVASVLHSN